MQAAMMRGQRSREGGTIPSSVYGLKVPAGDVMVPANTSLPISVCFVPQLFIKAQNQSNNI